MKVSATKRAALAAVLARINDQGFAPSGDDLARSLGVSRARGYQILDEMEAQGLITRSRYPGGIAVPHQVRLTRAAMKALKEEM